MTETGQEIVEAAWDGDLARIKALIVGGATVNARDDSGESVLARVVSGLSSSEPPLRHEIVRTLLAAGADPCLLDNDRCGPLTYAMLNMDTETLRLLLEAGADPNAESGFVDSETFYDWAEFDYRYEVYDFRLPEEPTEEDKAIEAAWLKFLDRLAVQHGKRRPDHLFLLRSHGARSSSDTDVDPEAAAP